jgi:hypothetical protein
MLDDLASAQWRKSNHSSQGVDCVEVANLTLQAASDSDSVEEACRQPDYRARFGLVMGEAYAPSESLKIITNMLENLE